jgi:hypothetical protein
MESPTALSFLSPGQRAYAEGVVTAMVQELGIERRSIRLVLEDGSDRGRRVIAIDASPNGQHVGNYSAIIERRQANPDWYMIRVDGELVDALAGTTEAAYRAMVSDAWSRDVVAPDSLALSQQNDKPWTATMLTGEGPTGDGLVPVASVQNDTVSTFGFKPHRGGRSIRVRAAIVVGHIAE